MQLPGSHLTYCLNIHRGETWDDHFAAIRTHALAVRDQLTGTDPDAPFGLGLRLGVHAAAELHASLALRDDFKAFLAAENAYPFTVNAFPFGTFHGTRVKENVYAPDWRSAERVTYTNQVADILADWLPDGTTGSISTVPCSFKPWIKTDDDVAALAARITETAHHLERLEQERGVYIHLGLEPEPACYLERTDEFITFYNDHLLRHDTSPEHEALIRRYVGVNFDCCHVALQYEDLTEALDTYIREGVLLSKIHLSAALHLDGNDSAPLASFDEPVYLHQVKARRPDSTLQEFTDLPDALAADLSDAESMRCHFHVPLFWPGNPGGLGTTRDALTSAFLQRLRDGACEHLEIETYTFDVLPPELQKDDVVDSIVEEYRWVLSQLNPSVE